MTFKLDPNLFVERGAAVLAARARAARLSAHEYELIRNRLPDSCEAELGCKAA